MVSSVVEMSSGFENVKLVPVGEALAPKLI